jgi:Protein of unknown function (DUF3105)
MADRKAPSQPGKKPAAPRPNTTAKAKPSGSARPATKAGPAAKAGPAGKSGPGRPGKKPKSIVNQKTTPWGLIATVAAVIILAVAVIGYAVTRGGSSSKDSANAAYVVPEVAAAKSIPGVVYKAEPNHNHIASGTVNYDTSPPTGGNHSPYWADCTGTVYPNAIANENAVHMLEHGAVWITYKPGLPQAQIDALAKLVKGVDHMAMSPYPGTMTDNISLQAWDYQLFVPNSSDKRIQEFINELKFNQKTTPEPSATCSQPTFITHPSTYGHPLFAPAT